MLNISQFVVCLQACVPHFVGSLATSHHTPNSQSGLEQNVMDIQTQLFVI